MLQVRAVRALGLAAQLRGSAFDTAEIILSVTGLSEPVTGGNGKDTLTGGQFGDLIQGFNGVDTLLGLNGDDTLNGGNGGDVLVGGLGRDWLVGGNGPDQFAFNAIEETAVGPLRDLIADFSNEDTIVLSAIDANTGVNGNQAFSFIGTQAFSGTAGQLRTYSELGNTIVAGDTNGDGLADFEIGLIGLQLLAANYFAL